MADQPRTLTSAELEKAKAWLEQRQAQQPCPICTNPEWSLSNHFGFAPLYSIWPGGTGQVHVAAGYPAIVVICKRCGFLRMHNAIMMGLVEADPPTAGGENGA
jgi:hypothetical protein